MRSAPAQRAPRIGALLLAMALLAACESDPEQQTPAEWLEENTMLLQSLRSYDAEERHDAIRTFKELGKERGSQLAWAVLADPAIEDYRIKVVLARILSDWKDRRAVPYLIEALDSTDDGAVAIAKEGLTVFRGYQRLDEVLIDRLDYPSPNVRRNAADVLSRVGGDKVIEAFGERMKTEADDEVRAYYLIAILDSRHPRRREFLVDALVDPDFAVRELAWDELQKDPELPSEVSYDSGDPPRERAEAVASLRRWIKNGEGS